MKTVAALSGFLCLGRHFFVIIGILLFFKGCLHADRGRQGKKGASAGVGRR